MPTPLTSLLDDAESAIVSAMTTVPLALMVVAVILRQVPRLSEWVIALVLWALGVAVGIAYADEPEFKHAVSTGFLQGTLSVGVALIYAQGIRGFLIHNNRERG